MTFFDHMIYDTQYPKDHSSCRSVGTGTSPWLGSAHFSMQVCTEGLHRIKPHLSGFLLLHSESCFSLFSCPSHTCPGPQRLVDFDSLVIYIDTTTTTKSKRKRYTNKREKERKKKKPSNASLSFHFNKK